MMSGQGENPPSLPMAALMNQKQTGGCPAWSPGKRRSHLPQEHAVPEIVRINGKSMLAGLMGGIEEAGQAGEAVEVDLDEIVDAVRGNALVVERNKLVVLAASPKLEHLEQRPDRKGFLEQQLLFGEEVEPEDRVLGEAERRIGVPMIRRVAEREAEGIGRGLRLDVIDAGH